MSYASLLEESLTEGLPSGTVEMFLTVLTSAIVQWDKSQSDKYRKTMGSNRPAYYNPNALFIMLNAAQEVRDEMKDVLQSDSPEALTRLKNSITRHFTTTRWRDAILKKIDAFVSGGKTPSLKATSLTMEVPTDEVGPMVEMKT